MKKDNRAQIRSVKVFILMLMIGWIFAAGISFGATINVYLRADTFTKTMPDGEVITMWGYVLTDSAFSPLPGEVAKVPGPTLTATAGDTLNIHVQNNITGLYTEPTSVIILGQTPSLTAGTYPTWTDGTTGPRTSAAQRVRSFTTETAVAGTGIYTFTGLRTGTYLYQSGTHPGIQVQMGLYGPLIVNPATAGRAYDDASTAYDSQVTLLYSEIDPELHYSIQSGLYGTPPAAPPATPVRGQRTSPEDYHPKYFLINGEPYWPGLSPIPAGNANQRVLIRFLNAGLVEKTPTLQNQSMTIIAEDGNLLPYSKDQYSLLLPAGKTMDVLLTPAASGYIPVYDRSLNLTNAAASPGGDLVFLQIDMGAGIVPAATVTLTVAKDGTGSGTITALSLPGGISCGLVCSRAYLSGTQLRLGATPDPGSLLTAWSGGGCSGMGDCIVTLNADTTVTATFAAFSGLTLLSPNGGEIIPAGSTYAISWGAPAYPAGTTFRLQYSTNGTRWIQIARDLTGSSYVWTVPLLTRTASRARVRVQAYNARGRRIATDTSNGPFTISVP